MTKGSVASAAPRRGEAEPGQRELRNKAKPVTQFQERFCRLDLHALLAKHPEFSRKYLVRLDR
jgi:hypothetical protein